MVRADRATHVALRKLTGHFTARAGEEKLGVTLHWVLKEGQEWN